MPSANRPVSGLGSHALSISMGVKLIANGAQVAVTIFEGGRFEDDVILTLAKEALKAAPETAFAKWRSPIIARSTPFPDKTPDYTVEVLFVRIKE